MRSSSDRINVAASAQRIDVDNRISLRFYYRIANNILKQADIFREEKNVPDLYIMLLRFSSLVVETIPCHRDYRTSLQSNRDSLRKEITGCLNELEKLQPVVKQRINELNTKHTYQANVQVNLHKNSSLEWPPVQRPISSNYSVTKAVTPVANGYQVLASQKFTHAKPIEGQFRRIQINLPRPNQETLHRHSILGPNGLGGQWQLPKIDKRVEYPSNIDLSPVEIPSLFPSIENGHMKKDHNNAELEISTVESSLSINSNGPKCHAEEPCSMISFEESDTLVHTDIIRQPSPPPVLAEVQDLIPDMSPQATDTECRLENSFPDNILRSEAPLQLHISTTMMQNFMKLAKSNTDKNLETCGVLAGSLKNRKFYVTALIIPKQESTSDSCQTTNEEEIFEVQDKQSLFPLGWIHTHPTQSCFMSSIDLHTHYSYQIMLPEAVAIVMAPRDTSRSHGIFRLTTPGGMSVIRHCQQRGFHPHNQPPDGGPIYKACTDVYMNPNLKFDVIDLR
ncbi:AMSH-like ubiquitin thioesterase 1 [Carica papaya]|uniref:AMSH-like ubiquitin thioesterase 1 n=1 Tax=Carica papaya TaxID=3649 RepID=UPI000B8CE51B|nr:AMSH-like ubiquitin thioesterase 1 [Carica papaya]